MRTLATTQSLRDPTNYGCCPLPSQHRERQKRPVYGTPNPPGKPCLRCHPPWKAPLDSRRGEPFYKYNLSSQVSFHKMEVGGNPWSIPGPRLSLSDLPKVTCQPDWDGAISLAKSEHWFWTIPSFCSVLFQSLLHVRLPLLSSLISSPSLACPAPGKTTSLAWAPKWLSDTSSPFILLNSVLYVCTTHDKILFFYWGKSYYQPAGISWQMLEHLSGDLRWPKCTVRPPPPTCWPGRRLQQVAGLPYLQFSQIGEPNSLIRKYEPQAVGEDGLWGRKDLSYQAFGMTPGSWEKSVQWQNIWGPGVMPLWLS